MKKIFIAIAIIILIVIGYFMINDFYADKEISATPEPKPDVIYDDGAFKFSIPYDWIYVSPAEPTNTSSLRVKEGLRQDLEVVIGSNPLRDGVKEEMKMRTEFVLTIPDPGCFLRLIKSENDGNFLNKVNLYIEKNTNLVGDETIKKEVSDNVVVYESLFRGSATKAKFYSVGEQLYYLGILGSNTFGRACDLDSAAKKIFDSVEIIKAQ